MEADELPPDSGSYNGEPEANGLRHQTDPGGATKDTKLAPAHGDAFKEALAALVASLNEKLGRGGYELNIEVLEGELDLAGLDLGNHATEPAPPSSGRRPVSATDREPHVEALRRGVVRRRRGGGR